MSIYTILLELILSKISEKNNCPAPLLRGGAKNPNSSARAQKILLGCGAKGNFLRPRPFFAWPSPPEKFFKLGFLLNYK